MLNSDILSKDIMDEFKSKMSDEWSSEENKSGREAMEKLFSAIASAVVKHIKEESLITVDSMSFGFVSGSPGSPCTPSSPKVKAEIS